MNSRRPLTTIADGPTKDGTVAAERVRFLIGHECKVRVWWSEEGRIASPGGDLFQAILVDVVPIGRDYYFVFQTGPENNPKRSIIKTAAVLQIVEL